MIPNWRNYDAISVVLGYVWVFIIYRVPNQICIYLRGLFAAIKYRYLWNNVIHLIILTRVISPTLEDFYCSSAGDVNLRNFGKSTRLLTITNDNTHTVVLIKFLPYSGATAQTRSVALWGVSGSYRQAPAQQGMSGLVRETSHLWLYSSPSPSLQPILRESATSILIVLYTFECIMWVANESLRRYVQGNKWILKLQFHNFFAMWLKWCTETTY